MSKVCLISQTGNVLVDRQFLVQTSKVFATIVDQPDQLNQKWPLQDFSQHSLEQLAEFVQQFSHVDCKLPEKLESNHHDVRHYITNHAITAFIEARSRHEIMELLFLSNFIDYPLLFHICCIRIACWMSSENSFRGLHTPS